MIIEQTKDFNGITVRFTDSVKSWRFTYITGDTETTLFESDGETKVLDSSPIIIEVFDTKIEALDRMAELGLSIPESE